jgi:hypothetical protein
MLSEEVAIANAIYIGYASPNSLVYENEEYKEEMGDEAIEILYGVAEDMAYSYSPYYRSFDPEIQAYVNTLWEGLKTENSTELWVHITAAVITASVIGLSIYSIYVKRQRSKSYRKRDKELKLKRRPDAEGTK